MKISSIIKHKKRIKYIFLLSFLSVLWSCKKLIEIDPPIESIIGSEVFNSNTNAAAVLTGIYTTMSNPGIFTGKNSIGVATGLAGDELVTVSEDADIMRVLYENTLTNQGDQLFWTPLYGYIFRVNAAIEGISASSKLSNDVRDHLLGEAKFLRAFYYFYLVNLYGDVPLLLSTDINRNSIMPRTGISIVYEQMIRDLKDAQNLLPDQYLAADAISISTERLRPNKAAATALLARAYLFKGDWNLAEVESTRIISNTIVYHLGTLAESFKTTSKEAIWQLQSVAAINSPEYNTIESTLFTLAYRSPVNIGGPNSTRPVYLSKLIFNDFEPEDQRKALWIDSIKVGNITYPYAFKYKQFVATSDRTENLTVLRLAEQYLIRAEARAKQGKLIGNESAIEDINVIRLRAGLTVTDISELNGIVNLIYHERQVEFFTEWGHRWLDLKRSGRMDFRMSEVAPYKGSGVSWSSYKALFPIPVGDLINNRNLTGHQNPGYPER